MASAVDICSSALVLIGANPISSFTEPGAGAKVSAQLYESTLQRYLTDYYWGFATKKQSLNKLSQEPLNQFTYAYQLPTDMLSIITVRPLQTPYSVVGRFIYSNQSSLDIDYIYRPDDVDLPAYFTKALEYKLASDFALAITNNNSLNQTYEAKAQNEFAHARSIDSRNAPPIPMVSSPFTDARNEGNSSWQ